jgi:hypothetical protein
MKQVSRLFVVSVSGIIAASCGTVKNVNRAIEQANQASDATYDSDDAYLSDTLDATATQSDSEIENSDNQKTSELSDERASSMAAKMFADIDTDQSSSASLEEFLAGPEKMAAKFKDSSRPELSNEQKEKMKERLTVDFKEFAGDDSLLSLDELKALLKAKAPRAEKFRKDGHGHGPGRGPQDGNGRGPRPPHSEGQHRQGRPAPRQ